MFFSVIFSDGKPPSERMYVNYYDIKDSQYIQITAGQKTHIMCASLSDPQSQISINTDNLVVDHGCRRIDGKPPTLWNCSASTDIIYSGGDFKVQCEIKFKGKVYPTVLRFVKGKTSSFSPKILNGKS